MEITIMWDHLIIYVGSILGFIFFVMVLPEYLKERKQRKVK